MEVHFLEADWQNLDVFTANRISWYRTNAEGETETYVGTRPPVDDGAEGFHTWEQDPDTLDTWFSSALWTWSTLIDPDLAANEDLTFEQLLEKSQDFQAYHPTNVLESGWDIIFFWIARMILSTTYMTKQVPFKTVYLHGMVRAEDGKKMSKSRPESIVNPLDVIKEYGTDALRMGLIGGVAPGQDMNWSRGRIEAARNFCNKLWNIARYIEGKLEGHTPDKPEPQTLADHWILHNMNYCIESVSDALNNYRFAEAYDTLYHFVWDDVADWYIEASKTGENLDMLSYVLENCLVMLHPFAPFVTETIWQTLHPDKKLLALQPWPKTRKASKEQAKTFEDIKQIITEVRHIKNELKVQKVSLYHKGEPFLTDNGQLIASMARLEQVQAVKDGTGLNLTQTPYNAWLDIDKKLIEQFVDSLKEKRGSYKNVISQLEARLSNKSYVKNAPKKVVDQTKDQLAENQALLEKVTEEISRFKEK